MAQGTTKGVPIDIDPTLAADSDLLVPSQKAIKAYVDNSNVNQVTGTGVNNEIAYFNTTGSTVSSLSTATYPSLTELSYVKGVTSAIQTQLGTKANLSQAQYTMLANNTNGTANMTAQTFRAPGIQTYTGTITWTGTTQPSGATNHTYNWTQIGNLVTLNITIVYAVAGSALTAVTMSLPADCPSPLEQTGLGAVSEILYFATGQLITSNTTTNSNLNRAFLRVTAASSTAYELGLSTSSGNYKNGLITVQYFTT